MVSWLRRALAILPKDQVQFAAPMGQLVPGDPTGFSDHFKHQALNSPHTHTCKHNIPTYKPRNK